MSSCGVRSGVAHRIDAGLTRGSAALGISRLRWFLCWFAPACVRTGHLGMISRLKAPVEPADGTPDAGDERRYRKITKRRGLLGRRPADQQPGHPPYPGDGNHALAARHAGPPRLQEQAVPFAGTL